MLRLPHPEPPGLAQRGQHGLGDQQSLDGTGFLPLAQHVDLQRAPPLQMPQAKPNTFVFPQTKISAGRYELGP